MYLGSIFFVQVGTDAKLDWTKLDKAERLWRLQPAVQLIYTYLTVCMYIYKERKKEKKKLQHTRGDTTFF